MTERSEGIIKQEELRGLLSDVDDRGWLGAAEASVRVDPDAVDPLFARAERTLGRRPFPARPEWTPGRAGRALLLAALADAPDGVDRIAELYRCGDPAERLAVLQALPLLPIGAAAAPLLHDALRTNDTRLVSAALGPYAAHLDQATWRQGVVKCVFMGIPLATVDRLAERADDELIAMLAALAEERTAAGRELPPDAAELLDGARSQRARSQRARP